MSRRSMWIVLALLALAFAVRLWLFTGYRNGDVGNYVQESYAWAEGRYSVPETLKENSLETMIPGPKSNWQNLRLGMIVPTAWAYQLFGVGDLANTLVMFAAIALGCGVTWRFGSHLFGSAVGISAAAIYCFVPIEISLATALVPHIPTAAVTALGSYAFWRSIEADGGRRLGWAALAGGSVAIAYAIWEFSILMVGVFGLYWLLRLMAEPAASRLRLLTLPLQLGVGFVPLFAIETIYFYRLSGVPFFRQLYISQLSPMWLELHPADEVLLGLDRFPKAMAASYHFGLFYYLVFFGVAVALLSLVSRRRDAIRSPLMFLLSWWLPLLAYLQFGTSSFSHYQPTYKLNHYLGVITIPGALLAAYGIHYIAERLPQRLRSAGSIAIVTGFIVSSIGCAWVNHVGNGPYRRDITHEIEMQQALDAIDPALPIYVDNWTQHGLDFVYRYERETIGFTAIANLPLPQIDIASIDRGLLLINWRYLSGVHTMATELPDWLHDIPDNWELVDEIGPSGQGVAIYRARGSAS